METVFVFCPDWSRFVGPSNGLPHLLAYCDFLSASLSCMFRTQQQHSTAYLHNFPERPECTSSAEVPSSAQRTAFWAIPLVSEWCGGLTYRDSNSQVCVKRRLREYRQSRKSCCASVSCVTCRACEAVSAKIAPGVGVFRIRVLLLLLLLLHLRSVAPLVSRSFFFHVHW